MYNYHDDTNYGEDRLCGTICSVKGYPSMVTSMNEFLVCHRPLLKDDSESNPLEDLDPTPVHIGYCNLNTTVSEYLFRLPERQYKQGLQINRLRFLNPSKPLSSVYIQSNPGFVDAYINKYPKLSEIEDTANCVENFRQAFHKEYALHFYVDTFTLLYRSTAVGSYNINKVLNGQITLLDEYKFLTEEVEEIIHGTA